MYSYIYVNLYDAVLVYVQTNTTTTRSSNDLYGGTYVLAITTALVGTTLLHRPLRRHSGEMEDYNHRCAITISGNNYIITVELSIINNNEFRSQEA
jgi:hypothetical protein